MNLNILQEFLSSSQPTIFFGSSIFQKRQINSVKFLVLLYFDDMKKRKEKKKCKTSKNQYFNFLNPLFRHSPLKPFGK